jgi:P4 family phage/plasmid primase-like protien
MQEVQTGTLVKSFYAFLNRFKVKKGEVFNYTLTAKPFGSFFIPQGHIDEFNELYSSVIETGTVPCLTEKPGKYSPILIDLDFKYELSGAEPERKHTPGQIDQIAKMHYEFLERYIELDDKSSQCFIFERPAPYQTDKNVKDGVHMIFPYLNTPASVKLLAREHLCRNAVEVFQQLGTVNPIHDIIDKAVIERNNWYLYGSGKPGCDPYVLTRILDKNMQDVPHTFTTPDLIRLLSVKGPGQPDCRFKDDMEEELNSDFEALQSRTDGVTKSIRVSTSKKVAKFAKCDNIDYVRKLVEILGDHRADDYQEWIELGWCLHNINLDLLEDWIKFSKRSPKFTPGYCESQWDKMKEDGLGMGSLVRWAREDDPDKYLEIKSSDIRVLLEEACNTGGAHYSVAKVLYAMYKYQFVCLSRKFKTWIEFRGNKWYRSEEGYGLLCQISTQLYNQFNDLSFEYSRKAGTLRDNDPMKTAFDARKEGLGKIATNLLQNHYKTSLMKEVYELFYVEGFEELLDTNTQLIGFDNGVYDLDNMEFREGRPEDCITLGTGHDYAPYDPLDPMVRKVERIVGQILMKEDIREYVLKMLASSLSGQIRQQRFHVYTGSGSNGKSQLVDMFMQGFGTYATVLPISLLTSKRNASNSASPELIRVKGRRFCVLQEPENDVKLNVGLMKELTGGDKIISRDLFCPIVEFKPQFKLVLTCNKTPDIPSNDGGTWRRIRAVEFVSKFCENPNPHINTEFPVDIDLASQVDDLGKALISILIPYYKKYLDEGLKEPEAVMAYTLEYQKRCDNFLDFVADHIVATGDNNDVMRLADAFSAYKEFFRQNQPDNAKLPGSKDLKDYINSKVSASPNNTWRGYKVKTVSEVD